MEEDDEFRTRKKGGDGRKRAKKRNPFIEDECELSKTGREKDEEQEDRMMTMIDCSQPPPLLSLDSLDLQPSLSLLTCHALLNNLLSLAW